MKMQLRSLYIAISAVVVLILAALWFTRHPAAGQNGSSFPSGPKYIFIFLADGAGIPHMEITRQYNRVIYNEGLVITDKIMKEGTLGLMTTHAADSRSEEHTSELQSRGHLVC